MFSWARQHAYGKGIACFYCARAEVAQGYCYSTALGNKNETLVHFWRLGLSKERPNNRCWPPAVLDYIIDQGLAPQLISLLYCHEPQQSQTSGWPGPGQSIAVTLTLAKELCGFDLLFDEGRIDLVNSTCHLPSDSGCNLESARPLCLQPRSRAWLWTPCMTLRVFIMSASQRE